MEEVDGSTVSEDIIEILEELEDAKENDFIDEASLVNEEFNEHSRQDEYLSQRLFDQERMLQEQQYIIGQLQMQVQMMQYPVYGYQVSQEQYSEDSEEDYEVDEEYEYENGNEIETY